MRRTVTSAMRVPMRSLIRALLPFCLVCLTCVPGLAGHARADEEVKFSASASTRQAAVGDQIEVSFLLEGSRSADDFRQPSFEGFGVLAGPNQSSNFQMINGAISVSITFSYIVQPLREGNLQIGPASVTLEGKSYSTQPLAILVSNKAARSGAARGGTGGGGGGGSAGGGAGGKSGNAGQAGADVQAQIAENLFMRIELDRQTAYQGEQITATFKIYTRVNIVNYTLGKVPSFEGFWSEDLDVPGQNQLSTETIDGQQYRVGVLKNVALFPQRSGELVIGPMEVECVVQVQGRRRSNDIFDQFFNDPFFGRGQTVNFTAASPVKKINVKALPEQGRPASFSGAVGDFRLLASMDKTESSVNDAMTYRIAISGTGNLKLLTAPRLEIPTDIEKYDPKVTDALTKQGRLGGSRTFEYLLVPRHPGSFAIPAVEFSYFDPVKKSYRTAAGSGFTLTIGRGTGVTDASAAGLSKEDIRLLGEDIRFIRSVDPDLTRSGERFAGSPAFFLLAAAPFGLFAGALILLRKREKLLGDVAGLKSRRARKIALSRLARAKKLLGERKDAEFYAEVSKGVWGYCSDRLGIPPAELALERVRDSLTRRGAPEALVAGMGEILERCDQARFAASFDHQGMEAIYDRAVDLLSGLERSIR